MKFLSVIVFLGAALTQAAEQAQNAQAGAQVQNGQAAAEIQNGRKVDANNRMAYGGYGGGSGHYGGSGAGAEVEAGGEGGKITLGEDLKKLGKELIRFQGCVLDRFWKDTKDVQCGGETGSSLLDCICSNKERLTKNIRYTTNACFGNSVTTPLIKDLGGDAGALGINVICGGYHSGGGEGSGSSGKEGPGGQEGSGGKEGGSYGGAKAY
ncbi:hypothetical protein CP532_6921 [Ophiocordyceps camponoti-leonardi (nom. inval.)]|nr:hypothetical protein CP532_6921 [Ophiocordyceps camponoti-leonardi (nom. inval.)]